MLKKYAISIAVKKLVCFMVKKETLIAPIYISIIDKFIYSSVVLVREKTRFDSCENYNYCLCWENRFFRNALTMHEPLGTEIELNKS